MAECQLLVLKDYPKKHKDASMIPVADGEDLTRVTRDVNALMQADIAAGELTVAELEDMVGKAAAKFQGCMQ